MLALALPCTAAQAYDFTVDGIYYDILSTENMTCAVAINDPKQPYTGEIVIPEQVVSGGKTYTVTAIGMNAFQRSSIKSI